MEVAVEELPLPWAEALRLLKTAPAYEFRRAWQTFWLAAATIFMVSLDATVLVAAYPGLRAAFIETSAAGLSWVINGYNIGKDVSPTYSHYLAKKFIAWNLNNAFEVFSQTIY